MFKMVGDNNVIKILTIRGSLSLVAERSPRNLKVAGSIPTRGALLEISAYALTPTYGTAMSHLLFP